MNVDFNNPENAAIPHPEKVHLGSGTLHLACSKKKTVITVVITAFIFGFFAGNMVKYIRQMINGNDNAEGLIYACFAGIIFVCGTILSVLRAGEKYSWSATGREFTVSRKNRGASIIFYKARAAARCNVPRWTPPSHGRDGPSRRNSARVQDGSSRRAGS